MLLTLLRNTGATAATQRALVVTAGVFGQLPIGQEGTGKKPIVMVNGVLQQRVTSEGIPVVLVSGTLRALLASESLII